MVLIDLKRYAQTGEILEGQLPLSDLNLPAEVLGQKEGLVHYQFRFGVDEGSYVYIHGQVKSELNLECQRCLKPFEKSLESEFWVSPVRSSEDAKGLPEKYDPVFLESDKLSLAHLVEEELILSLPIAPMHADDCKVVVSH